MPTRDVARRAVQLLVVVLMISIPVVARYNNYVSAREIDRVIEKWEGRLAGKALETIDVIFRSLPGGELERGGRVQRSRSRVLEYAQQVRGGPWSAEIADVSLTDPLAGAEAIAASRSLSWVLIASLIPPLVATVLLGRVFCSWVCPMGFALECTDKLRGVLRFLELSPGNARVSRLTKYGVLCTGLLLAVVVSTPVLGYLYPPAMVSRELNGLVLTAFDRAEMGRSGFSLTGLSWITIILVGIVVVEMSICRRWWCRYICPGGALYSLLGAARPVRVNLVRDRCTKCADCNAACPMGLSPMDGRMGIECDNCGVCISACNDAALGYVVVAPLSSALRGADRGGGG